MKSVGHLGYAERINMPGHKAKFGCHSGNQHMHKGINCHHFYIKPNNEVFFKPNN